MIIALLSLISILNAQDIIFEFNLDSSEIQTSKWIGQDVIEIPDGVVAFDEGYPSLPGIPYSFLLPQQTSIGDVTVSVHSRITLDGRYSIAPVSFNILSQPFSQADRASVYLHPEAFPIAPVERTSSGNRTGFRLGSFTLVPFSYNPLSGELSVITSATVTVECVPDPDAARFSLTPQQINTAAEGLAGIVDNPECLTEYSPESRAGTDSDPVWIAIGAASLETVLQPLVDHRNEVTGPSEYVTVEWIVSNYSGYDTQEKIRNYLKDQFNNHSLIYVLMVGDYGETTRISSYSSGSSYLDNVTDHYYIDLDGSWDGDGDHLYGEANDGIFYYSDLYVGRFSSDYSVLLQRMVDRTIAYETQAPEGDWQKTAILIGAGLWPPDYWGSFVCEDIDYYIPSDWNVEKLYETAASHPNNQIDLINEGSSFVSPQGHGWYGGISWYDHSPLDIISIYNYNQLDNIDKLPVFHSIACMSGELTATGCIAERLMLSPFGGAIAVMFNSSYGWGTPPVTGPSEWLEIYFARQLFSFQVHEIGMTQALAKDDLQPLSGVPLIAWVTQENNLLGDPALTFITGQTGIEDTPADNPLSPELFTPSPNPMSGSCSISYDMPFSGTATMTVYDITGRAVRNVYSGILPVGAGSVVFDGKDSVGNPLPPGCYAVVISGSSGTAAATMVVAR